MLRPGVPRNRRLGATTCAPERSPGVRALRCTLAIAALASSVTATSADALVFVTPHSQLPSDGEEFVAYAPSGVTRIYDRHAHVVLRLPKNEDLIQLVHGAALVDDYTGFFKVIDLRSRKVLELPGGVRALLLGRYWVLGQRSVTPVPTDPRAGDQQYVFVNRRNNAIVPAGESFSDISGAPPAVPDRRRLDSPDLSVPPDPRWIPADRIVLDRRGNRAVGNPVPASGRPTPLEFYARGHKVRRLSTCRIACRDASFGSGVVTWLEDQSPDQLTPLVKVWDGKVTRTLRHARLDRASAVLSVAHVQGRVFVLSDDPKDPETELHSYPLP